MGNLHVLALENLLVHQFLHISQLLGADRLKISEVKSQPVRRYRGTCLIYLVTYHLLQSSLQQMSGSMVASRSQLTGLVHFNLHGLANLQLTFLHISHMIDSTVRQFFCILGADAAKLGNQQTLIAHLSAAFSVERSLVENDAGLFAVLQLVHQHAVLPDGNHLALSGSLIHHQLAGIQLGKVGHSHALVLSAGAASAGALLLHGLVEAFLVQLQSLLMENFFRQFPREAVSIVEAETDFASQFLFLVSLHLLNFLCEKCHALCQGSGKAVFLQADDLLDIILLGHQFAEIAGLAVDVNHGLHCTFQELVFDAQHAAMTDGTTQDAAQHITASLIGGQDAVHDHYSHGTGMVGDNLQRNILCLILAVLHPGNLGSVLDNGEQQVGLEVCLFVLHHGSQALQATAGINVLMSQGFVLPILSAVILGEHQVPDFQIPVAIAAYGAVRRAAAALLPQVDVNLGVWAARAGADFPEIVLHLHDVVLGEARLGLPDLNSLIVVGVNCHPKLVLRQFHHFRQEFPSPGNSLALEIIPKGEVPQHLKISLMACSASHIFDIASTHATLASCYPGAGRLHLAREKGLQRRHAGTNQEQGWIILRNQGKAG